MFNLTEWEIPGGIVIVKQTRSEHRMEETCLQVRPLGH